MGRFGFSIFPTLCWTYFIVNFRYILEKSKKTFNILLIIVGYNLIISAISVNPIISFINFINFSGSLIFILIAIRLLHNRDEQYLKIWVIASILINTIFVLGQYFFGIEFSSVELVNNNIGYETDFFRYIGCFEDPQKFGQYITISLFLIIYFFSTKKLSSSVTTFMTISLLILIFLTGSKSPFIGLIIGIIYTIIYNLKKEYILYMILSVITIYYFRDILEDTTLFQRFTTIDESVDERFIFWKSAFEISTDYPMGIGYGNYSSIIPKYDSSQVWNMGDEVITISHPESGWLLFLVEFGYLLTLLLIISTIYLLLPFKKNNSKFTKSTVILQGGLLSVVIALISIYSLTDFKLSAALFSCIALIIYRKKIISDLNEQTAKISS
ncbi:MAG: O-antigen ligase family protein [Bacteroidales bacterium]|nr:O-antigen ligase family protein [Bacteroidales bacterium]